MNPNHWLPVVQRLAREVDVENYIYDADGRNRDPPNQDRTWWRSWVLLALCCGPLVMLGGAYAFGYRLTGPEQRRLVEAVYRVDPRPERWTDQQLSERLTTRREAMDLLEHAVAAPPSSDLYPYMAELTGHPPPLIEPGRGPALLLLANALDQFPVEQRGMLVDRILTVAAALGEADVQEGLSALAALDRQTRQALFAHGSVGLKRIFDLQATVDQATTQEQTLLQQLEQQENTIKEKSKDIDSKISATQKWVADLGRIDHQCRRASDELYSCVGVARSRLQR